MDDCMYVINQAGRDKLRDALVGCLKAEFDPEAYADAAANEASVRIFDGQPEASFEVRARDNIHGVPWTIDIFGPNFFNLEPLDD